jgi:D-alanyl-D-alanine carboxypeptidase/D-alanyl-D-alanine-endopeptidase (penicillin-binding protein 4)
MLRRTLPILLLLLLAGFTGDIQRAPVPLADRIDAIIEGEEVKATFWGLYVRNLTTGEVLYEHNADKTLMPASNQKLFTTATALDALGSDYRYQTTLYFDGEVDGSVMRGDLLIDGSGDPTFGSRTLDKPDPLEQWAKQLAAMGVTRIEGRIIGDDDVFEDNPYGEGWDISYIATETYAPAKSGLTYHDNIARIRIDATGGSVRVEDSPAGFLTIKNDMTRSRNRNGAARLDRRVGTDTVRLFGSLGRAYEGTVFIPVSDPTAFALHAFKGFLQEAGIEVAAQTVDVGDLNEKPTYKGAEPLFVVASPPLSEIISIINKRSNNLYAEQVFHTFGWGGASSGGERRVKALLDGFGVATNVLSFRDGSGLSRKDMTTPEALGTLLANMAKHPESTAFMASLAGGGEARTTLDSRLRGIDVQAKTGSLEYARALSGYVTAPNGHRLAFALLANNYAVPAWRVNLALDSIVLALATTDAG